MGYDITAFFHVNQKQIDEFIHENNIDKTKSKQHTLIVDYYKTKNPEMKEMEIMYHWNRNCEIHEFFDYYGTNFIRDDERFIKRRYHKLLVEKHNFPFPDCLKDINFYLRTTKDAIEIVDALHIFFSHDDDLMRFANWLRLTSKHCAMYDLSR